MTDVSIGPAHRDELPRILELLEEVGLPCDGFANHLSTTLVARGDGRVVGCSALELYAAGRQLTEAAALELSRYLGVEEAYLLTETADHFFPRFEFRPIPRSEVPRSVRSSVEFTSACPASAIMVLDLRAS